MCTLYGCSSIRTADIDCAMYLMAASGLFVTIRALLGDLQVVCPSAKAWLSLSLVTGTATLVSWLILTSKVSLGSLIVSIFALCVFIYGMLEIAFALLDRWAVRSDMFSDVVRYGPQYKIVTRYSSRESHRTHLGAHECILDVLLLLHAGRTTVVPDFALLFLCWFCPR